MKKYALFLLLIINFILLTSCNTSRPSAYLTKDDRAVLKEEFYVYFDTNGGSKIERVKIEKGHILNVPNPPVKEYAEFNGWYLDSNFTKPYDFGSAVENSFTLYANWLKYYKISFEVNGGNKIEDQYIKEGYNLPFVMPVREGFQFDGWYLDSNFNTPFDFASIITEDLVLYARWL